MNGPIIWAVAIGGAVGSVARLLVGVAVQSRAGLTFPLGTLLINVSGSFLLGLLVRLALETSAFSPPVRALLTTGLCGGYTTFSTFSLEMADLIGEGLYGKAAWYATLSLTLGVAATFGGFAVAHWMLKLARGR